MLMVFTLIVLIIVLIALKLLAQPRA